MLAKFAQQLAAAAQFQRQQDAVARQRGQGLRDEGRACAAAAGGQVLTHAGSLRRGWHGVKQMRLGCV
jgi:hypothetical protein